MKSFTEYLNEADYKRFLKKNKNLNDEQRKEINKYYSRTNTQAGSIMNWQSKEFRNMTYDDFVDDMINYKSGFKEKLKVNIPGSQGKDYWQVRLKTKGFLAYIPLHQKTAEFFNSAKFGTCKTRHCIGWEDDPSYWDEHVIDNQEVPVYIIDGRGKWVVIIVDGNRKYQVWDKRNKEDISKYNKNPIPGLDIKKELMTSKLKSLYDDIREEFYNENERNEEIEPDWDDARSDYDQIIRHMNDAQSEYEGNIEDFNSEMNDIKYTTLEKYDELRKSAELLSDSIKKEKDDIEELGKSGDAPYLWKNKLYTQDEFDDLYQDASDKFNDAYKEYLEADNLYDEIYAIEPWEMPTHHDDYEWEGEVPDEDDKYSYVENLSNYPDDLSWWDDYYEYADTYGIDLDSDTVKQAVWSYVFEGYPISAEAALLNVGLRRP